jgi:hypothetical protein
MQNYEGPYTSLNWVFILFIFTIVYFRSLQCSTFCYEIYLYFPSIITYTSSSHSFILLSRWFYHFFRTLRESCTYRNWIFVLLIVTVCTSQSHWSYFINLANAYIIFATLCWDFALSKVNLCISCRYYVYFPLSLCVLSEDEHHTSCHHRVYFMKSLCVLPRTEVLHFSEKEYVLLVTSLFFDAVA